MSNKLREYESATVSRTLDDAFCPSLIAEARSLQDQFIIDRYKGKFIDIADIGCGDGAHGAMFAPECRTYHGFEISRRMANGARKRWIELGLENARVVFGDAANADLRGNSFDVAWCLYFTPGNLRDEFDELKNYDDNYLNNNPQFIAVVTNFFHALKRGGKLLLTVYKDVPEAEAAQREFYERTEQHILTPLGSRFVATAENFWSVRWTRQSMLSNLSQCGVPEEGVAFISLNAIAWVVEITRIK